MLGDRRGGVVASEAKNRVLQNHLAMGPRGQAGWDKGRG
jgi:hypothetical protein